MLEPDSWAIYRYGGNTSDNTELCGVYSTYENALLALPPERKKHKDYFIASYYIDGYINSRRKNGLTPYTVTLYEKKYPTVVVTPPENWVDKFLVSAEDYAEARVWAESKEDAIKKALAMHTGNYKAFEPKLRESAVASD